MDFKKIYEEALTEAGSIGNLSKKSFDNYGEKYAKVANSENTNKLIAGKLFTFYYNSKYKQENGFINRRPLLFIVSDKPIQGKRILRGIDLMLLPPMDRLRFIIRFTNIYQKPIEINQEKVENDIPNAQMPLLFTEELLETLFGGINYNHSYTGFRMESIQNLKEIPITDWHNMIYLNTKSIEGANIEEIYNKFK